MATNWPVSSTLSSQFVRPRRNSAQRNVCRACGRTVCLLSPDRRSLVKVEPGVGKQNFRFTAAEQLTLLCEACKKFYCRYRDKIKEEKCTCGGRNTSSDKCRFCRFQRCQAALLEKKSAPAQVSNQPKPKPSFSLPPSSPRLPSRNQTTAEKVDFSKLPCAICGFSSSGFHFGVVSCEGCKGFFRRSVHKDYKIQYACKATKEGEPPPTKLCSTRSNCRKCRLQRCIDAGMSLDEIAIGRHTIRRRAQIDSAIKRHSAQGSFLQAKICRRKKAAEAAGEVLASEEQAVSSTTATNPLSVGQQGVSPAESVGSVVTPPSLSSIHKSLAAGYGEHVDPMVDERVKESCDLYIDGAVKAVAKLAAISTRRVILPPDATVEQFVAAQVKTLDDYAKCISEFVTILPGVNRISVPDRIVLFSLAFFPISAAQLSLHFDVERQLPNNFSLDREGSTWDVAVKLRGSINLSIEEYLREAGNRFVTAIANLTEFALFCALLFLNPETSELENIELVRSIRHRYDLALLHNFAKCSGVRSEQRLGEIYLLLPLFRRATDVFHNVFVEINEKHSYDKVVWTPLFTQIHSRVVKLTPTPSSSTAT